MIKRIVIISLIAVTAVFGTDAYIKSIINTELDKGAVNLADGYTVRYAANERLISFMGRSVELHDVTAKDEISDAFREKYAIDAAYPSTTHFDRIILENAWDFPREARIQFIAATTSLPEQPVPSDLSEDERRMFEFTMAVMKKLAELKSDSLLEYSYSPETDSLNVSHFDSRNELAVIRTSFDLSGIPDNPDFDRLFDNQNEEELNKIALGNFDFSFFDTGLISELRKPFLDSIASSQDLTPEQLNLFIEQQLPLILESAIKEAPPAIRERKEEIISFINKPQGFGFHINPAFPISIGNVKESAKSQTPLPLLRDLNLSISLNPTPDSDGSVFQINDYL